VTLERALELWRTYGIAEQPHDCIAEKEDFTHCEVCDESAKAAFTLSQSANRLMEIIIAQQEKIEECERRAAATFVNLTDHRIVRNSWKAGRT